MPSGGASTTGDAPTPGSETRLCIRGDRFLVNGRPTYCELPGSNPGMHGLLMNARFIQGVFDDRENPRRFARFGRAGWDPEVNTDELIGALGAWHDWGLRAFTVGFQGGGPCFTTPNASIDNNPYGADGRSLDGAYASRMDRLIRAADRVGMAVIVSFLYQGQIDRIRDDASIRAAVVTASRFLRSGGYANVIVEVANEHDVGAFRSRELVCSEQGMAELIRLARRESGGMPTGASAGGGAAHRKVVETSDVVLIHGNGQSRQQYHNLVRAVRAWAPDRPVVCNEDSPALGNLDVALAAGTSWGYYNNMTKQEPPADWGVTQGQDRFFALRLAAGLGIRDIALPLEEQFYLQGLEPRVEHHGKRWLSLASLHPELIHHVEFHRDGSLEGLAWDEPFSLHWRSNWFHDPVDTAPGEQKWSAVVHLRSGEIIEKCASLRPLPPGSAP